jgi:nucleotide-binding universal stress UspA family protein
MYERILLPTDGSLGMASAVEQCFHQASASGAAIHALYVVDVRAYAMLPPETGERVRELLFEAGGRAVDYLGSRAEEAGIEIVTEVVEGIPHEAILSYVDENDVDLVVMGTHGHVEPATRIVGSVAEAVVRHADVPVMTVRMREADAAAYEEEVPDQQRRYIS